ncbi:hypothetical protein TraAM80_08647 [Trypanosoma rangeli]|uniref:Uncharacterized protein n=1 Tax=Trypanosoma rangeli TaxID=5698 RepID=A0A422MZK3_TRYRA|nr:uncharacterized protein TraAM80_08647 [Trypanosoma rangeli]RNE98652.1 hypothetical protein TraAM80_08647 [Trypanosoma rangeli]|eukprot:RNE98652.1 hypothetical protein TraAM80_08647 [Trypanosoma rangeli]
MKRVPHPSGVDIIFDAKWHQYKLGHTALRSVSKVLDKHFPFDEKRVLALVSKKTGQPVEDVKAGWNRQALLGKNIHEYIEAKLCGLPPPTWTLLLKRQQKQAEAAKAEDNKKKRGRNKKEAAAAEAEEGEQGGGGVFVNGIQTVDCGCPLAWRGGRLHEGRRRCD